MLPMMLMVDSSTHSVRVLLEIYLVLVATLSQAVKVPGYILGQKMGSLLVRELDNWKS